MKPDPAIRALLEATYARLRERLEAKDVSAERLRTAALEALAAARSHLELDPAWVAQELDRLRSESAENGDKAD